MTSKSLHPTPAPRTIAVEQFRSVGLALRKEAIFFVCALVVLGVILIAGAVNFAQSHHSQGAHMGFNYDAAGAMPMFLVGLLLPFGVWKGEDPSRRAYHWSMPVARGPHTMMKLISGWAWLMIATVLYLLFIVIVANAVGMITGDQVWRGSVPVWEWLVAFTAPTIGYLITSIPVIGSEHPWRWIGGVLIGYGVVLALLKANGMDSLAASINSISDGRYGLNAALLGATHDGERGISVGVTYDAMTALRQSTWLVAMPLWIICSAIGATVASYRHQE